MKKPHMKKVIFVVAIFMLIVTLALACLWQKQRTEIALEAEKRTQYQDMVEKISTASKSINQIGYLRSVAVHDFVQTIFLTEEEIIKYTDDKKTFEEAALQRSEVEKQYAELPFLKDSILMDKMNQLYKSYSLLYEITTVEKVDFSSYETEYSTQLEDFNCTLKEINHILEDDSK